MATHAAALNQGRAPIVREVPHTVSPGLWTLAWRRLRSDRVGMVSLVIVVAFFVMMILSAAGLIASDWNREVGVNYAPPSFLGAEAPAASQAAATVTGGEATSTAPEYKSKIVDPIGDVIARLKAGKTENGESQPAAAPPATSESSSESVDPLAAVMADIRAKTAQTKVHTEERKATLPFGGDKWGRDVLKKTIKGSETSIFVGLAAAALATFLGTVFGALAGYFGKWVDDLFNWFYSVF
ncbi:MAG TPA: ABC transporter permease, partial [Casimicrobiaceae bacterium]|nr:ABC transporter permease [Casimicrobiaceae bacterium]